MTAAKIIDLDEVEPFGDRPARVLRLTREQMEDGLTVWLQDLEADDLARMYSLHVDSSDMIQAATVAKNWSLLSIHDGFENAVEPHPKDGVFWQGDAVMDDDGLLLGDELPPGVEVEVPGVGVKRFV